ncbi:MAG TPA: hypothetical protein VNK43_00180 [Gemmatimonadales bacterium]|nr:hypothetical protein [Gemmatimonadales bacterium]
MSRRLAQIVTLALVPLLLAGSTVAQQAPGSADRGGLRLSLGIARSSFRGALADTATIPDQDTELGPASRVGVDVELAWRRGAWEIGLGLGYSSGALRAETDDAATEDRTFSTDRFRAAIVVGRRIARLGANELLLAAGPTLDRWTLTGSDRETRFGAQAELALRIPLGAVELENSVAYGISGSPFDEAGLPPTMERRALRTLSVGAALRIGL